MNPPHLIRENSFKFNNSGSSSYNFAEIWPFLVNGDGSDGVLLQSFQQSGEKRGQFVGLGFAENCNRDVSVDESTVTEQSTGELQQSGRGGGGRKRQEGSEDESSKLLSTSSDYNVTDSEYKRLKVMESREKNGYSKLKQDERSIQPADPLKQDYIHVKARRGQATDSHSLAERARREKISERMKILQDLVPGCNKVIGKALVLDEIINYIQSLQRQVEFLSMKLEAVNSRIYASNERFPSKDFAMQTFDTASMTFGSQATMTYPRSPQEWLQMQVGGGFDRAT